MQTDLKALVIEYLNTVQNRTSSDELDQYYHPDIIQIEYPNLLSRKLIQRQLNELKAASDKGLEILHREEYDVKNIFIAGNTVIAEIIWTGMLKIPLNGLPEGGEMKAYFAQFFEFKDGKIIQIKNYDCFA